MDDDKILRTTFDLAAIYDPRSIKVIYMRYSPAFTVTEATLKTPHLPSIFDALRRQQHLQGRDE